MSSILYEFEHRAERAATPRLRRRPAAAGQPPKWHRSSVMAVTIATLPNAADPLVDLDRQAWCQNSLGREDAAMWIGHRGGPVGEPPTPEQVHQWHRRMSPPDNEFPAGIGLTVLLGRTNDAAVGITQIEAYSAGFRFTLAVRLRRAGPELVRGGLLMRLSSHVHPGIEIPLEDRLLLGLEYSNGHRASTLQDMRMLGPGAGAEGQPLMLVQQSGGGGEQSVDQTYWVSPLGVPAASRGAGDLRPGLAGLRYAGVPDGPRQRDHPRRRRPQPTALAAATGHRATGAAVPTPPILRVVRRAARLTGLHRLRGVQHAPR